METKESDSPKCEQCGGRTALISGMWYYSADEEPYMNGVHENAVNQEGDEWVHGFICDDCNRVQDMFSDSEANPKGNKVVQLEKQILEMDTEINKLRKALERVRSMSCKLSIEGNRDIRFFITETLS